MAGPSQRIIITPAGHHLREGVMEPLADEIIKLCRERGLTRVEAATMFLTIAVNHMVATNLGEERAGMATIGVYRWRKNVGFAEAAESTLLVDDDAQLDG